jgi:hypothetical protein
MMNERIKKLEILCRIAEYNEFGDVVEVVLTKKNLLSWLLGTCV